MLGDLNGAAQDYRQAVANEHSNVEALCALGELALAQGSVEEAVSRFSSAVAIRPEESRARLGLAVACERQGDSAAALRHYENVNQGSERAMALLRMGVIRCREGAFAGALEALNQAKKSGDTSDALLFYRGRALAGLGHCDEALREWTELQQRHPENERLQLNVARAQYLLGAQYVAQGNRDSAIRQWEQYLERYPKDEKVSRDLADLYFRAALDALREEHTDAMKARECLQRALLHDPQNPSYRFYAALCQARTGSDVAGSIAALRNLAEEGRTPKLLYHLGWCLLQDGKAEEAAKFFEEVRAIPEANGYGQYASWALANVLIGKGKFAEASQILLASTAAAPGLTAET
jgi:tetratricopeptide (TPR) repeat protein